MQTILDEEEELIAAHKRQIEETMNTVRKEMALVQEVDQPGSAIDKYVAGLSAVLAAKAASIADLQASVDTSRCHAQPWWLPLCDGLVSVRARGGKSLRLSVWMLSMGAGASGDVSKAPEGGGDPLQNGGELGISQKLSRRFGGYTLFPNECTASICMRQLAASLSSGVNAPSCGAAFFLCHHHDIAATFFSRPP